MKSASEFNPGELTYGSDNEESRMRLRELMLFVAERCQDDPNFGVTKLNKILFYCDFYAFAKLGKPITGISYNKLSYGPVPTAAEATRLQMEREGDAFMTSQGYSPGRLKRIIPRREANLDLFSGPEIALVDGIVGVVSGATASQLSELSHGKAWQAVGLHQTIPYEAVFLSNDPYTEEDIARADELVASGMLQD